MNTVRILLVEDNPGDVALLRLAVEELGAKAAIDVARDGEEALRMVPMANEAPYDLALVDINLPRIGGLDVLERLHTEGRRPGRHTFVYSSSSDPRDRAAADSPLVERMIQKPETWTEVLALVREVLSTARPPADDGER